MYYVYYFKYLFTIFRFVIHILGLGNRNRCPYHVRPSKHIWWRSIWRSSSIEVIFLCYCGFCCWSQVNNIIYIANKFKLHALNLKTIDYLIFNYLFFKLLYNLYDNFVFLNSKPINYINYDLFLFKNHTIEFGESVV